MIPSCTFDLSRIWKLQSWTRSVIPTCPTSAMGTPSLLGSMSYKGVWARRARWIQPPWVSKSKVVLSWSLLHRSCQEEVKSPQSLGKYCNHCNRHLPTVSTKTGRKPKSAPGKYSLLHVTSKLGREETRPWESHFLLWTRGCFVAQKLLSVGLQSCFTSKRELQIGMMKPKIPNSLRPLLNNISSNTGQSLPPPPLFTFHCRRKTTGRTQQSQVQSNSQASCADWWFLRLGGSEVRQDQAI